jgi:enterochelin esterase-like enzyme
MMPTRTRLAAIAATVALLAILSAPVKLAGCASAGETAAEVVAPRWVTQAVRAPGVERMVFESASARTQVSYHIFLPEEYHAEPKRRFPVLYYLHGTGGGLAGISRVADHFGRAMQAGRMPPMLIVFPNGLSHSMWVDARDASVPMETVVVRELVPHIDAAYRTHARPGGRVVEGFSMGGYGAGRFGFRHHDVFGAASMLAGGPLDLDFRGPRAVANPAEREMIFNNVFGAEIEYFRAESPWRLAEVHAAALRRGARLRIVVGDRDFTYDANLALHEHLTDLGIPHEFIVMPGIGHDPQALLDTLADLGWDFYGGL